MTYSLTIEYKNSDPTYVNNMLTWGEVTGYLRHRLDQWAIKAHIYKWSSDNRLIGEKAVTMSNIVDVCLTLRDKQVLI